MKIKAIEQCTYNVNGAPHGRRTIEPGEEADIPGRFALPFVASGKAVEVGDKGKSAQPKGQSVKDAKPVNQEKKSDPVFVKKSGWIKQYVDGKQVGDSMRQDEFDKKFPNAELVEK